MLTLGTLLLFAGGLMAIAATTPMGSGALIAQTSCTILTWTAPCLTAMWYSIIIATVISFIGAILILRNR